MSEQEQLSQEELAGLQHYLGGGAPVPDEKHGLHNFLHKVATAEDTTKLGYLKDEEIGNPKLPIRTYKELQHFCSDIAGMPYFNEYFGKMSEVITSTSLSRNAKLLDSATVQKQQLQNITTPMKENKGWFKSKKSEGEQQIT